MSDRPLFDRQREALSLLQNLVRNRAAAEVGIAESYQSAVDAAEREVSRGRKANASSRKKAEDELTTEREQALQTTTLDFARRFTDLERSTADAKRRTEDQHKVAEEALKTEYKDRLWTIDSLLEAGEKEAADKKADLDRVAKAGEEHVTAIWEQADTLLAAVNLHREQMEFSADRLPPFVTTDYEGKLEKCLEDVDHAFEKLAAVKLSALTGVVGTMVCVFFAGGLALAFALLALPDNLLWAVVIGACGGLVGGLALRQLVYWLAKRQVKDRAAALGVFLAETGRAAEKLRQHAGKQLVASITALRKKHADDKKATDDTFRPRIQAVVKQCVTVVAKLDMDAKERKRALQTERTELIDHHRDEFDRREEELTRTHDAELNECETRFEKKSADAATSRDEAWAAATAAWFNGLKLLAAECQEWKEEGDRHFHPWDAQVSGSAALAAAVPDGVRFGEYWVEQNALPDGRPTDERLVPETPIAVTVPAYLPFPDHSAVLLKARDQGRVATVQALQAMMLRFLTGLPPGKVRFTIIDPVGLGENFAAFMHLADADPQLVSDRIWTEPSHIEGKLADLTEHMENVIQKYLRNQYKSIEEYNRAAGEVAEPYRVLVIANFPTNFTADAAKRLVSVMSSGPACGVCTLLGVDSAAPLPRDFRLADPEQVSFNLVWRDGKFCPKDPAFAPFPLTLDAPPSAADIAAIVRRVGEASKQAARVEVPFSYIAPPPEKIWAGTSKDGFEVPIGRAGATRRQVFALGRGTAQHALVAGKTGSGKSTLLHALITNLSMIYSPDEAELYLIDFKKGVEFKMYAALPLPHAKVVAIESEREFGLSVLQRLDGILKERGDLFRRIGVNDLAGFREARPGEWLPRILLVVDEFQEFFTEEDKLSQEAALLLDRLVRQGRAFGVHVLLGSQTLGGAFSLARSTIDQMAVRIALQCSEADAQLILSKENTAARLLTRPGEAIYNDANGLIEGNDPFQVVWLDEGHREQMIAELRDRAPGRPAPLVFEGSVAADIDSNRLLGKLLAAPPAQRTAPPTVWLGDSVAIKDPTAAVFRPQSGANLLMVGQSDESAVGILSAALVSLAARLPAKGEKPAVTLFDGTPDDSEYADVLRKACGVLGIPDAFVERYTLGPAIGELADTVAARLKGESADRSPRFLLVNGLHRFRELRKPDDDFSFGRKGEKQATPGEHFMTLLRDGPGVGVHVIVWCDSVTNLTRALDRSTLREFTMRVLFQMNPNDSSQLIDTPAASRLGRNRALFTEDGMERPEKFRPYGIVGLQRLREIGDALRSESRGEENAAVHPPESMTAGAST